MNALIQTISQLVESVAAAEWKNYPRFPFNKLENPKARLFDACLFKQSASGALGFIWLEFQNCDELFMLPIRLSRYSREGSIIRLAPWSLHEAWGESEFFEAWRQAMHMRNPLITANNGRLSHRYSHGEPSHVALPISKDSRNICVRLDSQEAFKILRTINPAHPESLEVEILEHLTNQSQFSHFPKLISVFEYSWENIHSAPIATSMTYIQNSGTLWQDLIARLQAARYPQKDKEISGKHHWQETIRLGENLGRLIGEFHRAMTLTRTNPNLIPESSTDESRLFWIDLIEKKLKEHVHFFEPLKERFSAFAKEYEQLPAFAEKIIEAVKQISNLGLRIRTHGHLHLGQILVASEGLYLLDFEADDLDELEYRLLKHSCLKDVSSVMLSLKYAWHSSEHSTYSPLLEDFIDKESEFGRYVSTAKSQFTPPRSYQPTLDEIENHFLRYYMQVVTEDTNTRELLPEDSGSLRSIYDLYFLMRILKETYRDYQSGHPRCKLGLRILRDFMQAHGELTHS